MIFATEYITFIFMYIIDPLWPTNMKLICKGWKLLLPFCQGIQPHIHVFLGPRSTAVCSWALVETVYPGLLALDLEHIRVYCCINYTFSFLCITIFCFWKKSTSLFCYVENISCAVNWIITGSDNDSSPLWCSTVTYTNDALLPLASSGTNPRYLAR